MDIAGMQQALKPPQYAGWDVAQGVLMDNCNDKISVCGKIANIKVIHEHAKTQYVTKYKTFEDVVVCISATA
jgi:hypothetical protein